MIMIYIYWERALHTVQLDSKFEDTGAYTGLLPTAKIIRKYNIIHNRYSVQHKIAYRPNSGELLSNGDTGGSNQQ